MMVMGARRETARQGMSDVDRDTELSHGFDAGNYANAYVSEDYSRALSLEESEHEKPLSLPYLRAFTLGFFASYEAHELPGEHEDSFWGAYHSPEGKRCLELGFLDPIESPQE